MLHDEQKDVTIYKVAINHEEQCSMRPSDRENPRDWREAGKSGTKAECLGIYQRNVDRYEAIIASVIFSDGR